MHGPREFRGQCRIYHAVTLDQALPFEHGRHDMNPEMRLAARPVAGMALINVRLVDDLEIYRLEGVAPIVRVSVRTRFRGTLVTCINATYGPHRCQL